MNYGAITLDTSIFDRNGLKLEHGLLKKLEQFKGKPAGLVLSEVVLRELDAHLAKKIFEIRTDFERSLNNCSDYLSTNVDYAKTIRATIIAGGSEKEVSREQIDRFIDRTGAKIIRPEPYIDVSELGCSRISYGRQAC